MGGEMQIDHMTMYFFHQVGLHSPSEGQAARQTMTHVSAHKSTAGKDGNVHISDIAEGFTRLY